jgi:hypothetical protein
VGDIGPIEIISDENPGPELQTLAPPTMIEDLGQAIASLRAQISTATEGAHFSFNGILRWFNIYLLLLLGVSLFSAYFSSSILDKDFKYRRLAVEAYPIISVFMVIELVHGSGQTLVVFPFILFFCLIGGITIARLNWPNNPLLKTVIEVQGIPETK